MLLLLKVVMTVRVFILVIHLILPGLDWVTTAILRIELSQNSSGNRDLRVEDARVGFKKKRFFTTFIN